MMQINEFGHKIARKLLHIRLQPIRVYCFHHVSGEQDTLLPYKSDWSSIEQFQKNILAIENECQFISLEKAYELIRQDSFRIHKYAVLTADDGYKSLLNILPWLEQKQIPITLFINSRYLDGQSWSKHVEEYMQQMKPDIDMQSIASQLYLSRNDLFALTSPLISIASHGYEHVDATKQSIDDFRRNVTKCIEDLQPHPRYIPFHAYTWGRASRNTNAVLREMNITPVIIQGGDNYNNPEFIDRVCLDGKIL